MRIAARNADAAADQIALSKRQMRAYMSIVKADLGGFAVGEILTYKLTVENTGQSPAHDVAWDNWIKVIKLPEEERDFIEPVADTPPSRSVVGIGKGLYSTAVSNLRMSEEAYRLVIEGKNGIFLFGHITYKDIFGDPCRTDYRLRLDPLIPTFVLCEHGNSST